MQIIQGHYFPVKNKYGINLRTRISCCTLQEILWTSAAWSCNTNLQVWLQQQQQQLQHPKLLQLRQTGETRAEWRMNGEDGRVEKNMETKELKLKKWRRDEWRFRWGAANKAPPSGHHLIRRPTSWVSTEPSKFQKFHNTVFSVSTLQQQSPRYNIVTSMLKLSQCRLIIISFLK